MSVVPAWGLVCPFRFSCRRTIVPFLESNFSPKKNIRKSKDGPFLTFRDGTKWAQNGTYSVCLM